MPTLRRACLRAQQRYILPVLPQEAADGGVSMMLGILLGGALATLLIEVGNRDATILLFGLAMLVVWIREWNLHLASEALQREQDVEAERDRAVALRRMGEWGLLDGGGVVA
jgi:hypothetical protein